MAHEILSDLKPAIAHESPNDNNGGKTAAHENKKARLLQEAQIPKHSHVKIPRV
jgi:hypothetical protein